MTAKIQAYSELSNMFLDKRTDYFNDKQIIKRIFSVNGADHQETIRIRLTIIDSYYSTNMSRRYYGIQNISKKIFDYYDNDNSFKNELLQFIIEPFRNDYIIDLFKQSYGIGKGGESKGKAISLISKYAYFLTDFQFPIYDSIVFETYSKIVAKYPELGLDKNLSTDISSFISMMNSLNRVSGVNNFNKLDNLLWLVGKIIRGNFSLILNEETYLKIVDQINFDSKTKSIDKDKIIKNYIFENLDRLKHLINNDLFAIIAFAKEIEN
jgi:hypothetical protein